MVLDLALLDHGEQEIRSQSLDLHAQVLGHLALLQALVDPPDVLPKRRVVVILDAVVRPASELLRDVGPFVPQLLVQGEYFQFFFPVNWVLFDVRIKMVMPPKQELKVNIW